MTIGVISTRYARALYSLALDKGIEGVVYEEMKCMHTQFMTLPEIKQLIVNPVVTKEDRIKMLTLCAGGEGVSEVTKEFINFVVKRDKEALLQYMCGAYKRVYRKAKGILLVKLVSADEIDKSITDKICRKIEETYSGTVEFTSVIDKKIIGGYTVTVDNNRLDSSVLGELNSFRESIGKRGHS